jgi:hypothetical protein
MRLDGGARKVIISAPAADEDSRSSPVFGVVYRRRADEFVSYHLEFTRSRTRSPSCPVPIGFAAVALCSERPGSHTVLDAEQGFRAGFEPGYLTRQHRVEIVEADEDIARLLEIGSGALIVVRRRIRTVDGRPDNINDTYCDHQLALQFPEILSPADVPQGSSRSWLPAASTRSASHWNTGLPARPHWTPKPLAQRPYQK